MNFRLIRILVVLVILLPLHASADDTTPLLDCWAEALGGRARLASVASIAENGTFSMGGLSGTYRASTTSRGNTRSDVALGDYEETEAFSSGEGWSRSGSAPPHEAGPSDLARLTSDAYLASFSMFFADRMPGKVAYRGKDPKTGEPILEIRPAGGVPLTIRLDPESCLPHTIDEPQRDRTQRQTISAWKAFDGIKFPVAITQSTGDPKFDAVIRLESVELNAKVDEAMFAEPEVGSGIAWPAGHHSVTIPIELTQNHIFLPVRIDGKPSTNFVLDSGADMTVVSKEHAEALGLHFEGALEARGAGAGSVEMSTIRKPAVELGGIELHPDLVFAIPLGKLSRREGRPLDGVLGYDILSRFVVEIDYGARTLTLIDPTTFAPPKGARAVPVQFDGNTPTMKIAITMLGGKRYEGRVSLDTGNRSALILSRPFVEKNDLISAAGKTIDAPWGMGVGGATTQRIGRVSRLEIGPFRLENVITSFSTDKGGSNADPNLIGNVGGEALRHFVLWIDYPHQQVLLAPGKEFGEAFEFDMSGILFEYADEHFDRVVVRNVLDGSPASRAGIKVGDVLLAIDSQPASKVPLDAIRAMLRKPGEKHVLTIERDGKTLELAITTKRMI